MRVILHLIGVTHYTYFVGRVTCRWLFAASTAASALQTDEDSQYTVCGVAVLCRVMVLILVFSFLSIGKYLSCITGRHKCLEAIIDIKKAATLLVTAMVFIYFVLALVPNKLAPYNEHRPCNRDEGYE